MALPAVTTEIMVVFSLILPAVVLFATEIDSSDVTAISVLLAVIVF